MADKSSLSFFADGDSKAGGRADIGVVGLAVMGQNLILNLNDHGFVVCAYNRTTSKVDDFLATEGAGTKICGAHSLQEMVDALKKPRVILLMVKAGSPVDEFIDKLTPLLGNGDIIIDGGNSDYRDTQRRCDSLKAIGIYYVGSGISGGEEGARYGPSLMPGGAVEAWEHVRDMFQSIAAKVDDVPCCQWVGPDGAGHYVKMVHNGIEYGDMQLICEACHFLRDILDIGYTEIGQIFKEWNTTELNSYLIELTATVMSVKDLDGLPLVSKILDVAGQKGTGKWTCISSMDMGVPLSLITEAVFARCLSAQRDERLYASSLFPTPKRIGAGSLDKNYLTEHLRKALYASKIISYTQGFMLLQKASEQYNWNLNYSDIALMWRGGCIIRSVFLNRISDAFKKDPKLASLLFDDFFLKAIESCQDSWRIVISTAVQCGIPMPAFSSGLAYYDGFRCSSLPANVLQALRDGFGAHMYERVDNIGNFVHTDWTGRGGRTASSNYQA